MLIKLSLKEILMENKNIFQSLHRLFLFESDKEPVSYISPNKVVLHKAVETLRNPWRTL